MVLKNELISRSSYLELVGDIFFNPLASNDFLFLPIISDREHLPENMKNLARIYRVIQEGSYRELALSLQVGFNQLFFSEDNLLSSCVVDAKILPIYKTGNRIFFLFKRKTGKAYSVVIAKKIYFRSLAKVNKLPFGVCLDVKNLENQEIIACQGNFLAFPC